MALRVGWFYREGSPVSWRLLSIALVLSTIHTTASQAQENYPDTDQAVQRINELIEQGWSDNELTPSKPATDAEWCRRVFLDVVGRVPKVDELDEYTSSKSRNKRQELVERLLGDEYNQEYVRYWTSYWTNTLIGRTGGTERRSVTDREAMEDYLSARLEENTPYDALVEELLTASGSASPKEEGFNGAVNFLVEKMDENGVQATAKTAQIFLGTAVQCTQCHNHPFNEYRQNQFWELNAFFRQTRTDRMRDADSNERLASVVDVNFAGDGRRSLGDTRKEIFLTMKDGRLVDPEKAAQMDAPVFYELRNGEVRVAYPVYVDGTSLKDIFDQRGSPSGNSGALEDVNRRGELAQLVIADRQFDRALVNRIWAHFFGNGFTKPFDDMGPHNPPSHPELLEELGLAFRQAQFDQKALIRWIVLSRPYSLSSRVEKGNREDEPTNGATPQFSRFYVRQMQPEQLYESLLVATEAAETVGSERRDDLKQRWLNQFNTAFGNDEGGEATSFNGSITQVLTMMNGDLIRRASSTSNGSFLDRIANDEKMNNREKFWHLYQAALSRMPTRPERKFCNELLASRDGDVASCLQDIWWAVLNSNEFVLIH